MAITFFDILGIDRALSNLDRVKRASSIWPSRKIHFLLGDIDVTEPVDALMQYLQDTLHFKSFSPGATPDTVGFYAEIEINNPPAPPPVPFVIRTMPDIAFFLQDTGNGRPARCYVTKTDNGTEAVIEALPVKIQLPGGLLEPITETGTGEPPFPLTNEFVAGIYDSYKVELKTSDPSSIFVHLKVRVTQELDFIVEPAVVLSVGPCLFSGLPCFGVHDISFIAAPTLKGNHQKVEQAIEWTRHTIEPSEALIPGDTNFRGVLAVRTIDLDSGLTPLKELNEWINSGQPQPGQIQFVLQDVVIPFFNILLLPIPIHGTLGIRRNIEFGDRFEEAYSFASAPIKIDIAGFVFLIEEFIIESVDPNAIEENQFGRIKMAITRGELPKVTTLSTAITETATSITVEDASAFEASTEPTAFIIERTDPSKREIVIAHSVSGNQLGGVERGKLSTKAVSHPIGATIELDLFAENAITLGFADEWTAQAGWRRNKGIHLLTLGDNKVKLMGAKLGFSFKRLYEQNHDLVDYKWYEYWQLLVDLNLEAKPSKSKIFRIEILSKSFESSAKPVNIVWKDIGWNLGSIAFGGVQLPEGTQIVILNFIKVIIQEIAILTDKNGGTYFSVTGGLGLGTDKYGASIIVYRFRWRIAGNSSAAQWLLDGISFALKIKSFELSGTGMAGETTINEHLYQELAFGLDLKFRALSKNFQLGVFLYKGEVSGPVDNFKYRIFGFKLAFIPAVSGLDLYNIRLMAASNLAPNLAPPDASEQNLRLFKWYKTATAPLSVPADRKMNAWRPQEDSFAFGMGTAGAFGGTKALLLDIFIFGHHSPSDNAFMIAMELFILKSQKPVGFAVLEVDLETGKWALFAGVSLSFSNVLPEGTSIPGLDNVAALSGNLYIGNKPGTFALGQLSDQNTWFGFRMKKDGFFKMELIIAICIQFVDREEGPKGFGGLISAKGGVSFGVGKAEFYLNFVLIAGIWKNESSASGLIMVFEAGFRIKLFRVFRFGASIKVQLDFLGPNPDYKRLAFEIHIDTPWYLPDVTIRFEKIYHSPQPERQLLVSTPIIGAEAFVLGVKQAGPVLLTALEGAAIDEKQLFDLSKLRDLEPQELPQSILNGMTAVGVDSTIALNFKVPVDDKLTIGENTPPGAGTQEAVPPASSELSITYELVSFSIRRQPRYGANANQWTTLLAPEDTLLPPLDEWPSDDELQALFSSDVKVLWDRDVQSQGRFDPRRLLVNAETPFTLITENAEADESILISQPGWPCCNVIGPERKESWHRVFFTETMYGQRVPGFQEFSDSDSVLHWLLTPRPLVAPGVISPSHPPCARLNLHFPKEFSFAVINFDQLVFHFRMECYWLPQHRHASIVVEGFRGVDLLSKKEFSLTSPHAGFIEMQDAKGFTRVLFRFVLKDTIEAIIANPKQSEAIEVARMEYKTVLEQRDGLSEPKKCEHGEGSAITGKGKLAWLPNHNYEITATTRVVLQHNQTGAQEAEMVQRAYFRTKGMVGLNYGDHIGHEIEPYLEAVYPRADRLIVYREEPIAMAFREQFNILLPVDRSIDPNNPAELKQVLEWDLTIDKQGDPFGHNRISKSNPDWIVENRGSGTTNPYDFTVLIEGVLFRLKRKAITTDVMRLRVQGVLSSPFSCHGGMTPPPPPSQVLLHQPIDPSKQDAVALWEANTPFRANLKPKGGPCIHRNPFIADDVSAFRPFTEQGFASGAWIFEEGSVQLTSTSISDLRYYAVFGEADWNHAQVSVQLDPEGATAGIAIGVLTAASGVTSAMLALVDEAHGILKVQQWHAGVLQDLQQTLIPSNLSAPFQLELVAYDDQLEIRLDDAKLIVERAWSRSGQLALVAQNGGAFTRLTVESLDAYRFYFQSSRFVSFAQHIQSAGNNTVVIPAGSEADDEVQIIQDLYAATSADIIPLMQPGADAALRLTLFQRWAEALSLPLVQQPQALTISRLEKESGTALLLLESPEPLRFSDELVLTVEKEIMNPPPSLLPPGIKALEPHIPQDFESFENLNKEKVPGIKTIKIQQDRMLAMIDNRLLQSLPQVPRYALAALNHEGRLKYFLFELKFSSLDQNHTRAVGLLRDENDFNIILQSALIQSLTGHIENIHANQLFLLNNQGVLIKKLPLPDLSLPFFAPQHFRLLGNGNEIRTMLIPLNGSHGTPTIWTGGKYRFHFKLNRKRYPQELPDTQAVYSREVELELAW
ncbi:MAG: hypothetical protein AYP45_02420 [Candidatus Brocadia carolinensis]|uniref:Uncharacterized protein n=1 Tax=Candidatus Brocadia carolinensis TaxID=1004156 RepID=A0A1V4AWW1_9BACT|nr:MAG: hypothetical protein AYP45_02420 [Candidatus Brocadia caroliniensis]